MAGFKWRHVGIDESSKRDSNIVTYCAVATNPDNLEAIRVRDNDADDLLSKSRTFKAKKGDEPDYLYEVNYSWLEVERDVLLDIEPDYRWGVIAGSLLKGERFDNQLMMYIDGGKIDDVRRDFIKRSVSGAIRLSMRHILVNNGARYDKRVEVVNKADGIAYWLPRRSISTYEREKDRHRKTLLTDLIP